MTARKRVAVCHEWTLSKYGSEKVAARIAQVLDVPDVYTFAAEDNVANDLFPDRTVRSSRLGRSAFVRRHWRWFLPVMPRWWRRLDLAAYDVVVTCSHAAVNSIRVRTDAAHVSYCCTPMRYAWLWRSELGRVPRVARPIWPVIAALLRRGDRSRARNVDVFLAVSEDVARRIETCYGRSSIVVYPPVDTRFFAPGDAARGEFFLYAGRLVSYKRAEVAVDAAREEGFPLVIAGGGPELDSLKRRAGPTVEFWEDPSDAQLRDLYRRARALLFPGVEDFGIVMVEAQACGTPVIAFAGGGALEAVREGVTGVLYEDPSPAGLAAAVRSFDPERYRAQAIREHAERFSAERFDATVRQIVEDVGPRKATV